MRRFIQSSFVGAALSCAILPAQAQWYAGLAGGQSRAQLPGSSAAEQLGELGFADVTARIDDKGTAFRLHGGYRLHPNIAVEAGYADLGKFTLRSSVTPPGSLDTTIRSRGADLSVVGFAALGERFTLFARAGAFAARTAASYSGNGSVALLEGQERQNKRSTGAVYGVGAMVLLFPNVEARLEWARHERLGDELTGGEFDADTITAGIQWRF